MNKSTKLVIGALAILAIVAIGYFMSINTVEEVSVEEVSVEPIKIGMIAPMTGDLAFMGEGIRDAIVLANENTENTKYEYEVIVEDDQLDAKMSASAANKLISVDKVDAIITFSSVTGNVVAPIAEQNQIVQLGIA